MKRGRVSVVTILVVLGMLFLGGILAFSSSSDSPESASLRFMDALARRDAKALTAVTYMDDEDDKTIEQKWAESCKYNEHYRFRWSLKGTNALTDKNAVATINIFALGQSSDQDYRIPLVKNNNKWKVDLAVVDRNFFPSLPK